MEIAIWFHCIDIVPIETATLAGYFSDMAWRRSDRGVKWYQYWSDISCCIGPTLECWYRSDIKGVVWGLGGSGVGVLACYCSGSLEPESSCHDRDWIMELPMEADILTFTGILTPEDASVASCFPFDITISLSWFPLLSMPPLHSAIP